ncbi:MAG: DUF1566 domain-containing protein [Deltaproteobacteria bacterium]|nr:DUF1566 domain-containing protein [Deltaproteobacteria bacterium]
MRTLPLTVLAAGALCLAGCEFIVDPQRQGSTTATPTGAVGASGSVAANGSGNSGSTAGSNGSATGTESTGTSGSSVSSASTGHNGSSTGHTGPGSSGTSDGSTGSTSATGTVATGTSGTSTTSVGTNATATAGSTGTTNTTGPDVSSATATGTAGSTTGQASSTTGTGTTTGQTTSTTGTSGCATYGSTGGTFDYSCSSPLPPAVLPIHPAVSGGGIGTSGGTPPPAFSDALAQLSPDSRPTCGSASCPTDGQDTSWLYPVEMLCGGITLDNSGNSSTFSQSDMTQVLWQSNNSSQSFDQQHAYDYCTNGFSNVPSGIEIDLPSPANLVALLDFGGPMANNSPALLPAGFSDPNGNKEAWAENSGGNFWTVNFSTGAFKPVVDQSYTAVARCAGYSSSVVSVAPFWQCSQNTWDTECTLSEFSNTPILTASFSTGALADSWAGALDYCNTLSPCGSWRLPSYKELAQLANFSPYPVGQDAIDTLSGPYWSSTPAPLDATSNHAMAIDFVQPDGVALPPGSEGSAYPRDQALGIICVQ